MNKKLLAVPYDLFKPFSTFLLKSYEDIYLIGLDNVKPLKVGLDISITEANLIKVSYSIIDDLIEENVPRDEKDLFHLSGDGYFLMSGFVFEYTYSFSEYNSSNNDDGNFNLRLASEMSEEMLKKLNYVVVYLEPKKIPLDDNPLI